MCGIAGIVGTWDRADLTAFRDRALSLMECRGPDGWGAMAVRNGACIDVSHGAVPADTRVLFVHRRLAVLDPSSAGAQPMIDHNGAAAMTYNGEVYNYDALRAQLAHPATSYRGSSDSEVVLRWLASGNDASAFTGMFALAWVDVTRGTVSLVRDAFGIKPLFIARAGNAVAFASDPRVLLNLPSVATSVDHVRLGEFLRYAAVTSSGARTAFASVEQLPPGGCLRIDVATGRAEQSQWNLAPAVSRFTGSFAQATAQVREAFIESTRLHLKSDVRVGCALSGGIDSSAVACTMRLLLGSSGEIHAVSHIASEAGYSEERWIDLAAQAARATVHKVHPLPEDLPADLDDLILSQGEPIAGTSLYAQYRVFAKARAVGLTVMLDGQGADELLAGYTYYRAYLARERISEGRLRAAWQVLRGADARGVLKALGVPMLTARTYLPTRIADSLGGFTGRPALPAWVRLLHRSEYYSVQDRHRKRRGASLQAALRDSMETSLQGLLRYEDRNSMRFSIESRVPFLERDLVALLQSMPSEFLIGPSGQTKYVFREAMRGIVPDAILDRRDKVGFENDEARWLLACRAWASEVVQRAESRTGTVDGARLKGAWQQFLSQPRAALARRLWATLLYLRWTELLGVVE